MQVKEIKRFSGHQNGCKNLIRARFGPSPHLIMSGSEDGLVYIWDTKTGEVIQTLEGHENVAYDAVWNNAQSLLAR